MWDHRYMYIKLRLRFPRDPTLHDTCTTMHKEWSRVLRTVAVDQGFMYIFNFYDEPAEA